MEMVVKENMTAITMVKEQLAKYYGIVPTGDKQDLKKVRTDLNKLAKTLKDDEKEKVKPYKEQMDHIKNLYKEVAAEIETVKTPVDEMIKNIEADEKEVKKEKIQAYIKEQFGDLENKIEIKDDYLNLSKSMTSIKESINGQVAEYKHQEELKKYIPNMQIDIRVTGKANVIEKIMEMLSKEDIQLEEFDRRIIK